MTTADESGDRWNAHRLFFRAILLFAAVVRLKDLSVGLPLHTLFGENDTLDILLHILQTGDMNPHQFDLPGLAYYIYLPFLYLFYGIGHLMGYFPDFASVSSASWVMVGRWMCALFGIGTVALMYRLGLQFSPGVGLISMAILAVTPQHIEYSHMLRPEIPAIFFALISLASILRICEAPASKHYWIAGITAGLALSLKYTIGSPLLLCLLIAHVLKRRESRFGWLLQSAAATLMVFVIFNIHMVAHPDSISYWTGRFANLMHASEDFRIENPPLYFLMYLARENYHVIPLLLAGAGILLFLFRKPLPGTIMLIYPLSLFLWFSFFHVRMTHVLLPLHPFLSLWAAFTLEQIWKKSKGPVFRTASVLLTITTLLFPLYRSATQAYLFSRTDNRSKAELWMMHRMPEHSRIALLQGEQVELDPAYFRVESFLPNDYVLTNKDFDWFVNQGFDYIVVTSGQYMDYFVAGDNARRFREYFTHLFEDGETKGSLILDLVTHPYLIPDYRVKIYSTKPDSSPAAFFPAIDTDYGTIRFPLPRQSTLLSLDPGYYSLNLPKANSAGCSIVVRNETSNEFLVQPQSFSRTQKVSTIPFSIFPIVLTSRFSLFDPIHPFRNQQLLQIQQQLHACNFQLEKTPPAIRVSATEIQPHRPGDPRKPYLVFEQQEPLRFKCTLRNRGATNVSGYVGTFLSYIGEPQPWKFYSSYGGTQEFYLEPGQRLTMDLDFTPENATGDYQLSYWIFTREDLPFSPQTGGWFNKQIRINGPGLGLHPTFQTRIP